MEFTKLSLVLIGLGIFFMLLGVLKTRTLLSSLKGKAEVSSWRVLFFMMVFFLAGYTISFFFVFAGQEQYMDLLTGMVFLSGALFVFIVTRITLATIDQLLLKDKSVELLRELKERTVALSKTQDSLQFSEEKYRKIVEEAGEAVYSADQKGYFTYVNPMCKKLTGYSEKELIGKNYMELIDPEWATKVKEFYKDQYQKKIHETMFSFPIITKSGEKKWVEQIVTQQRDDGTVIGHHAIVRDITQRKKDGERLKEYEYFFNYSHDLVSIANFKNYFEIINPNFQKVLGYSEKELLETPFLNFIHPDDINSTLQDVEKLKSGNRTTNFINRYRKKDGSYIWLEWNATSDPLTGKIYAMARDITETKKIHESLKNSENFLNTIIENIPTMLFVKEAKDLKFIRFNKAGEELLGYSKEELMGKNDYDFFSKNEADFFTASDRKVLDSGTLIHIEEEPIHTKYKGERVLETKKIPILDENGKPSYLLGISNDITEQKKILTELNDKTMELLQSNNELEQFIYVASHDLQEPLRMVNSYLQLLEKRYKDKLDKDATDFINFAMDGSNRMRTLILSLLDYSRISRLRPLEDINVNELLKEVLAELSNQIKENNAIITVEPLPVVYGDKVLLGQLFENLISNAIKFKSEKAPEIVISGKRDNNEYLFSIKDNGIGIQKEYGSKLFTIFQRLNSNAKYPGAGIGLAICKKIIEKHNGKIWFESEFGKGAIFYFTIKSKEEKQKAEKNLLKK